jgi:DNA-binding CsgD family transcriptional regulator
MLIIDDAQWSDMDSAKALSFVLRRLWADAVLTILVSRGGVGEPRLGGPLGRLLMRTERVAQIEVRGLSTQEVISLAEGLGRGPLAWSIADHLRVRTGGNALYVRTVLQEMPAGACIGTDQRLAVPDSLAASIRIQLKGLPKQSQDLLQALAVADARWPLAQVARLAGVDEAAAALEPAVEAGLVDWNATDPTSPISLRHTLQRDVIYATLSPTRRRHLHSIAVGLVDGTTAWAHKVAATESTDPQLAADLERVARREAADGRCALAAKHLLWAAHLSESRADHERRMLISAVQLSNAEDCAQVRALRDVVIEYSAAPLRECILGVSALYNLDFLEAEKRFISALSGADGAPEMSWITATARLFLLGAYVWEGRADRAIDTGSLLLATGELDPRQESFARGLVLHARAMQVGPKMALSELAGTIAGESGSSSDGAAVLWRGVVRLAAGELGRSAEDLTIAVRYLRDAAVAPIGGTRAIHSLALAQYLLGHWDSAATTIEHGLSITRAEGKVWDLGRSHMVATFISAGRGDWAQAEGHLKGAESAAETSRTQQDIVAAALAHAVVAQAQTEYAGMLSALQPVLEGNQNKGYAREFQLLWQPLHVESLIGSGRLSAAEEALAMLRTEASEVTFLKPILAWLQGWLAEKNGDAGEALSHYRQGLDLPITIDDSPFHRALLEYFFGCALRVAGNRRDAVTALHAALSRFSSLGAQPFVERCQSELRACGARQPKRERPGLLELTNREREVAHLVAQGLTNREIASELFLSSKTIEFHLRSIFTKLNISNRRQLRDHVLSLT